MKLLICSSVLIILSFNCKAQSSPDTTRYVYNEFGKGADGLIYSPTDINALKFVVDSLNLKFKTCDLSKTYFSYPQTKMYVLRFESVENDLLDLKIYLESHPDLNSVINKYNRYLKTIDSNRLSVRSFFGSEKKPVFLGGNAGEGFDEDYVIGYSKNSKDQEWIYSYNKKDAYSKTYSIVCDYIPGEYSQSIIPGQYAKLIQYIDCMIDTSASIFMGKINTTPYGNAYPTDASKYFKEINEYLNKKLGYVKKKNDYSYHYLDSAKIHYAINNLRTDKFFSTKIKILSDLYTQNEIGNDGVEELIGAFISKAKELEIKRKRRVYGQCSMDNSPREHAKNIAMLAAETHSWDIFLRAHLDIMNDRFERMSDGSYAYGRRQTYIKELEVLDINVIDMMLGLCLRAYNTPEQHYNGTVWRIGRALAESKDRQIFEEKAKKIMQDSNLDQFNRSLIFLLYNTYLDYLSDSVEAKDKIELLQKDAAAYPDFLQGAIREMKLRKDW